MISYTITVYNEYKEILNLLSTIQNYKTNLDELIIVQTYRTPEETQSEWFLEIQEVCNKYADIYHTFHFQNKFADLKNYINQLASKSFIVNIDADELITADTMGLWMEIIKTQPADIYYVPRINTVEGYTLTDVKNYGWNINSHRWINWPDYQPRIFRNISDIRWVGDVHETLVGSKAAMALPAHPTMAIIHHKHIDKQRSQNSLYRSISQSQSQGQT